MALVPMTPLVGDAGAVRTADHALLGNASVTHFEYNLTGGQTSRNTSVFIAINKSAVVTTAAINLTGIPELSYVTVLGEGNSWNDGEDWGHATESADWNNDGYDDVAIGAGGFTQFAASPGHVEVYYGGPQKIIPGRQNWTGANGTGTAGYGGALTHGDYNHDGIDDLVIGETWLNFGGGPHTVWVYYGSASGLPQNESLNISLGALNQTRFGASLAGGIDLNNDGYDDLVIGEFDGNAGAGLVWVLWGSASPLSLTNSTTLTVAGSTGFGETLKPLGDTDGDGLGEFAVGLPRQGGQLGAVYVYEGNLNSTNLTQRWSYTAAALEYAGYSIAGGRDITGDGVDDLALGVPFKDSNGAVYVFNGKGNATYSASPDTTIPARSGTSENLGIGLDFIGDYDGDGKADMIAGGNKFSTNTAAPWDGRLYLFAGSPDPGAAWVYDNPNRGVTDEFGWRTYGLGDLNGDGADEFTVSVHSGANGSFNPGSVRVYYGDRNAFPDNVTVYLNGTPVWTKAGGLRGNNTASGYAAAIQAYLATHQGSANVNGDILVPFSFNFSRGGRLNVSNFDIRYSLVLPPPGVIATAPTDGSAVIISWGLQPTDGNLYSVWSNKSGSWAVIGNVSFPRVSFNDTNITAGATYYYYVTEWDTSVPLQSAPSPIVSATPTDILPPNRPGGFALTRNITAHRISATWTPNSDDTVRYEVWRRDGDLAPFVLIANVSAPVAIFVDNNLQEEVNYTYEVRAIDDVGLASNFTATLTERIPDLTPPATPANFNAVTHPSGTAAIVSWTMNTDDTVAYIVQRSSSGVAGTFAEVGRPTTSPFNATGLTRGQTYFFLLIALDKADLRSPPTAALAVFTVDTLAPDPPTLTGAVSLAVGNSVQVNWSAIGDDLGSFRVYTDASGSWVQAGEFLAANRIGVVENLTDGVSVSFRVTAVDTGGREGLPSGVVSATPSDTQRPGPPTGLTVTAPPEGASLLLVWSAPADPDAAGYRVFVLDPTVGGSYLFVANVTGATTYEHVGLSNGIAYRYQVSAFDEVPNEGPTSAFASGTPRDLIAPSPPVINTPSVATNTVNFAIAGTADPFVQVQIWVRGTLQSTEDADGSGHWSGQARLITGDNTVYAVAIDPSPIIDASAKTSENSATIHFTLDTARPTTSSTTPGKGATGVDTGSPILVTFGEQVQPASVHIVVTDASGNPVTGALTVDAVNHSARFVPAAPLAAGATYSAQVNATDLAGNAMAPETITFTTATGAGTGGSKGFLPGFEGAFGAAALAAVALLGVRRRRPGQHR